MALIKRVMTRCSTCTRWWSVGPGEQYRCPCGGLLVEVDMKAFIAALPDGTKVVHNHPTSHRKPRGACPACDAEYVAEQTARDQAARAAKDPKQ